MTLPTALVAQLQGAGFRLREPIREARLKKLTEAAGTLPEGVVEYLATTDGMDHDFLGLCGSDEMLEPDPSSALLPLRSDKCGNYDVVLIEPGFGFGAVTFWDHETAQAGYVIASSVTKYLELLARLPKFERWSPQGENHDEFLRLNDPAAIRLLENPRYPELMSRPFGVEPMPAPPPGEPLPEGACVVINPFTKERVFFPTHRTPPR